MTDILGMGPKPVERNPNFRDGAETGGTSPKPRNFNQNSGNVTETLEMGPKLVERNPNLRDGAETGGTLPKPGNVAESVEM